MLSKYDQPEPKAEDLNIDIGWMTVKESLALIDAMHLYNKPGLERIHSTLLKKINTQYDILKWSHDQSKMQLVDYAKRQAAIESKEEKAMSEYSDLNEDN